MGDLISVIGLLKQFPTEITVGLSIFLAILVIYLKSRDIDITAATSISKMQMEQIKSLMDQNKELASELRELRVKLKETYEEVSKLSHQITDLENTITVYENRCDTCPYKPPGAPKQ